jgi:hypothetical protein
MASIPARATPLGSNCRDYLLQKCQGAHAGRDGKQVVETYDQVDRSIQANDNARQNAFNMAVKAKSLAQPNAMRVQMKLKEIQDIQGGSVLTVRNRWNVINGIPLSEAIREARAEMPTLRVFHALFCRSYMEGKDPLEPVAVRFG